MTEFLVVTGLSGAGRSTATNVFEDLGWFKIDNLPPSLVPPLVDLIEPTVARVALGVGSGARGGDVGDAVARLSEAADGPVRVLFLDAQTEVLVSRFESTRRRHPLDDGSGPVSGLIEREREHLASVRSLADAVIDTSDLNVHQLRERIVELFGTDRDDRMQVTVLSFGFKHGLPRDVDLVADLRFLPNPHWKADLRPLTGRDQPVSDFVLGQPAAQEFLERWVGLLELLLPAYEAEGKSYLTIGIGCTGGHHRSVAMAEALAAHPVLAAHHPVVRHRDIER